LQHNSEYRLQFAGRSADNLEHVGGGCLLLQRLAQLIEQPRILDGDNDLFCEIADQLNLLVAEWADFSAANQNRPNGYSLAEQRNRQSCSMTVASGSFSSVRVLVAIGEVRYMDGPRFEHRTAGDPVEIERLPTTNRCSTERPVMHRSHDNIALA